MPTLHLAAVAARLRASGRTNTPRRRRRGSWKLLLERQATGPGAHAPGELLSVFEHYQRAFDAALAR